MKRRKIEQWMLLEQSGELSPRRSRRLRAALGADPALQGRDAEWRRIVAAVREEGSDPMPSAFARARILDEAERALEAASPPPVFAWNPAWAAAAASLLLLLAGLWIFRPGSGPAGSDQAFAPWEEWEDDFATRLDGFETSLSELAGLWTLAPGNGEGGGGEDDELNELGRRLLELEG